MSTSELVTALRARLACLPQGTTYALHTLTRGLYTEPVSEVAGSNPTEVVGHLLEHTKGVELELEQLRAEVLRAQLEPGHIVRELDLLRGKLRDERDLVADLRRDRGRVAFALGCSVTKLVVHAEQLRGSLDLYTACVSRLAQFASCGPVSVDNASKVIATLKDGLRRLETDT